MLGYKPHQFLGNIFDLVVLLKLVDSALDSVLRRSCSGLDLSHHIFGKTYSEFCPVSNVGR